MFPWFLVSLSYCVYILSICRYLQVGFGRERSSLVSTARDSGEAANGLCVFRTHYQCLEVGLARWLGSVAG